MVESCTGATPVALSHGGECVEEGNVGERVRQTGQWMTGVPRSAQGAQCDVSSNIITPTDYVSILREGTYVHRLSRPNADECAAQLQNLWSSIAQDVAQKAVKVKVVRPQAQV
eukprot:13377715-Alexandrium_andersonii.AAC.1